jgi:hypothetical protein
MKRNLSLTVVSLLTLVLMIVHLSQDTVLQAEGRVKYPIPMVVFSVWLYATLTAHDRVWGMVTMLIGGLFATLMIVLHAKGTVVSGADGLFFVWTLFALNALGIVMMGLSARALWATYRSARQTRAGAVRDA